MNLFSFDPVIILERIAALSAFAGALVLRQRTADAVPRLYRIAPHDGARALIADGRRARLLTRGFLGRVSSEVACAEDTDAALQALRTETGIAYSGEARAAREATPSPAGQVSVRAERGRAA